MDHPNFTVYKKIIQANMSLLIIKQAIIDLLSPLGIEWITRQAIVQSLDLGEIPVT